MTKNRLIAFTLILLFSAFSAEAQKVKYKDVYGLLSTKQYEPAEPFLKRYLKDNDDNPNALLFMAIIFQEKAAKMDILKQTSLVRATIDSSILFYDKAYKSIDERELRKNSEYYEAYNRRDLRTGEFGVKLSDVQFDIEKKIQALKERSDKVKMVKHYFTLSDSLYKKSVASFNNLRSQFADRRQLLLRSDESTVKALSSLALRFDSALRAFESYKTSSSGLGRTGYNQNLTIVEIKDFSNDGSAPADFYQDDLKLWDYKKFSEETKANIEKDIFPMRKHLLTYDIEINKLREKMATDSISVRSDLTKLIDVLLYEQLRRYDPDPLPMEIFSLKTSDLEYRSVMLEHKPVRDSADVHFQMEMLKSEASVLHRLDSIANKLHAQDIDQKALDYATFVTAAFGNTMVLHSYVRGMKEYAAREKAKHELQASHLNEMQRWVIDGSDSIPLTTDIFSSRFAALTTVPEAFTVGLAFKDTVSADGYFYEITRSRKPGVKVRFPVDNTLSKKSNLQKVKSLSYSDPAASFYYVLIYNETPADTKFAATLAKIYRADGLAWSNNIAMPFIPTSVQYKADTAEVVLASDVQQIVVDKNGKVK